MLLQSRTVTFNGSPSKVMPWAMEITARVNALSGVPVSLWMVDFGHPIGTLVWSAADQNQSAGQAALAPLATDAGYMALLDAAQDLAEVPGSDRVMEVIHWTPTDPPPVGATLVTTTAVAAVDQLGAALAWSVAIAQHGESLTGRPVTVAMDRFGQMGTINWLSWTTTLAEMEAAGQKLNGDAGYIARMAETKNLFIPGSGQRAQYTRLA